MIRLRILTALVLVAVLIGGIVLLPPMLLVAALGVVFLGGFWEWAGFLGIARSARRLPLVLAGAGAMVALYALVLNGDYSPLPILLLASLWWLAAFVWVLVYPTAVPRPLIVVAAFLVVVSAWLAVAVLLLRPDDGAFWLLAVFVLVWAADTGAYFTGRAFGRHKLAPAVSPGKTWEGVAGGLLLALVVAALIAWYRELPTLAFMGLALLSVAASIVGDLTVSIFKRNAGLKDSGQVFPGHGGILDRLDSICAAAPVLTLGLALPGLIY